MKRKPLTDYRVYVTLNEGKVDVEAHDLRPVEKENPIEKETKEPDMVLRIKKKTK